MKKLDNKGWGLTAMIVYSCIIIFFLLIATFFVLVLYHGLSEDLSNEKAQNTSDNKIYQGTYNSYLTKMSSAAEIYFLNQGSDEQQEIVSLKTLYEANYIEYLFDPVDQQVCSGYCQKIMQDDKLTIKPYLKCSNYISQGYGA